MTSAPSEPFQLGLDLDDDLPVLGPDRVITG